MHELEKWGRVLENPLVARVVSTLFLVVLVFVLAAVLRRALTGKIDDTDLRYRARKVIGVIQWILVALVVAGSFSDKLGGIALSLGVVGAGVAFALQEVIASVAGRVAIQFQHFYSVGDRVQLGGIKGDVIDIGLLRTTIMEMGDWVRADAYNGRIVRVANSFVFKEPVFNYSGEFEFLWDEVVVPVRYGSDHKAARRLLEEIVEDVCGEFVGPAKKRWAEVVRSYRIEEARIEPMVTLVANDNWLEFTVRYVVQFTKRRITKDALFTRLLDGVDASCGKIQLASATYELTAAPTVNVRLTGKD